jgi:hypothetical protein
VIWSSFERFQYQELQTTLKIIAAFRHFVAQFSRVGF